MAAPGDGTGEDVEKSTIPSTHTPDNTSPTTGKASVVRRPRPTSPPDPQSSEPNQAADSIRRDTGDNNQGKTPRTGKLDSEAFISQVEGIVSGDPSKGSIVALMKLLRTGYGTRPTPDHLNRLFGLLQNWPECSRLALSLYIETRKKRSSELMRSLRNRLLALAKIKVNYPAGADGPDGKGEEERAEALIDWIGAQFDQIRPRSGAKQVPLDLPRTRWIMLSLMDESTAFVRYAAIYGLLDHIPGSSPTSEAPHADLELVSEIGGLFTTEKLNLQRVNAALRAAGAARSIEQQRRGELRRKKALLDEALERSDNLSRVASDLERQLHESQTRLAELESLCEQGERELAEQRQERLLDQEHWQDQCDQRLNKLAGSIRSRLGHEINEAKISLSQETPNVRMALERLGRIEKTLERLKDE
jgi:hypothetical protein